MDWIKRSYDATGLTQYPVGRHLRAVQDRLGGSVFLCLDVSGSMLGSPLRQATEGCRRFVADALEAHYQVALLLWHHGVADYTELTRDIGVIDRLLAKAVASGGNDILPTLRHCEAVLTRERGDLVIAIFGDGDLGNPQAAQAEASRLAAKNIRIMTCGLGNASAEQLNVISTEAGEAPRVASAGQIADAIASMATGLTKKR